MPASSSTSSRTSARSSTSEVPPVPTLVRLGGAFRLVHPFPSILDAAVVALVAVVGGGAWDLALRLAAAMLLIQFAIGALNDVVDAPRDLGHKPGKPIPAGLVSARTGSIVAVACAAGGLALALTVSPLLGLLALACLSIGAWYDLGANGTPMSWLPFVLGIPLLPVFGWFGATGALPEVSLILVPAAAVAGGALAIANSVVDVERDQAAGASSIAVVLGPRRAAWAVARLDAFVAVLALGSAAGLESPVGWMAATVAASLVLGAGAALGIMSVLRDRPGWRERAWEVQAVGTGLLAVAWLGGLAAAGVAGVAR